jgi:GntR family transcriptional repressor for pyruvate dehydrogenase complex
MAPQVIHDINDLQPIRPTRIYAEIVDQILKLINRGDIAAGDRLPSERQLAQQLNVSRSALREAMTALEVLGIVEIKAGVGIFIGANGGVASNSGVMDEVAKLIAKVGPLEILEVRMLIEPGAAQLAAERRTAQDLRVMDRAVRQMEAELKEGREAWEPDWGFHRAIAAATQNPLVEAMFENLGQRMDNPFWALMRTRNFEFGDRGQRYLQDHRKVLEAIRKGRDATAFRAMRDHIQNIRTDLEADESLRQTKAQDSRPLGDADGAGVRPDRR